MALIAVYTTVASRAAIRELHSYELPAIHAVAVEAADAGYEGWVADETREEER